MARSLPTSRRASGRISVVTGIAIQPDGKVVVGGHFNADDSTTGSTVECRRQRGPLVPRTQPCLCGPNSTRDFVRALALQPDGRIVIGGLFLTGDIRGHGIARLNADGSLDTGYNVTGP